MLNSHTLFGDAQRLFLNPSIGCEASCSYCYLKKIGLSTGTVSQGIVPAEQTIQRVNSLDSFKDGKHGTIISIGCYCDPWSEMNRAETSKLVDHFLQLGNPIQVSTKQYVDSKDLLFMGTKIQWFEQISFYVSCSTVTHWSELEKGTPEPHLRFRSFSVSDDLGIPTLMYIKPVIKDITVRDLPIFLSIIDKYRIDCVVGSYFSTEKSERRSPIGQSLLFYRKNSDEEEIRKALDKVCQVYTYSTEFVTRWRKE